VKLHRSPNVFYRIARPDIPLVFLLVCVAFLPACQINSSPAGMPTSDLPTQERTSPPVINPTETPSPVLVETPLPRQLSICLSKEPKSLFLYDAVSPAARSVLAAIYDGPYDRQDFQIQPVILDKLPTLKDGDMLFEPKMVSPGESLVDAYGDLNTLDDGVVYRPSGCFEQSCVLTYTGDQPVQIDEWVIRFHLKSGLLWANGNPLKADDSVYSYEVAAALYPAALPTLIQRTQSYKQLDELTVEWRGVPGYLDADIAGKFFSPLPRLVWGMLKAEELRTAELTTRQPLGWGSYQIVEWVTGDHITLQKNPNYFRASEGLPAFDILTFRFVMNSSDALDALLAGECDLVDPNAVQDEPLARLAELQQQGKLSAIQQPDTAWEQILFGIDLLDDQSPRFFASKDVRQAIALCIDRQSLVEQLFSGQTDVAQAYIPAANPLFDTQAVQYAYDPAKAQELLQKAGWVDQDDNPQTPRTSQSVAGLPDGVALEVNYLVSPDEERQAAAGLVQASLAGCGIRVNLQTQDAQQYLAPGPEGPVFGRRFEMAQFAWPAVMEPPCYLYTGAEIPGPYPEYSKGWGGVNASGYTNPDYDQACRNGMFTLPEMTTHAQAYHQAQAILADDLPAIPLYWHFKIILTRPDFCGVKVDASTSETLWDIEVFNYGGDCQ